MFAEILGKLLFWCGEDKIIYGSEASIFHPQWALRAFMGLLDPRGPVRRAKRKILGENLLRLHGIDAQEMRTKLAGGAS